jgi:hypothetical protein
MDSYPIDQALREPQRVGKDRSSFSISSFLLSIYDPQPGMSTFFWIACHQPVPVWLPTRGMNINASELCIEKYEYQTMVIDIFFWIHVLSVINPPLCLEENFR